MKMATPQLKLFIGTAWTDSGRDVIPHHEVSNGVFFTDTQIPQVEKTVSVTYA